MSEMSFAKDPDDPDQIYFNVSAFLVSEKANYVTSFQGLNLFVWVVAYLRPLLCQSRRSEGGGGEREDSNPTKA